MVKANIIDEASRLVRDALNVGFDEAAVEVIETVESQIRFSNNSIDIAKRWISRRINVFVAKDGRMAVSTFEDAKVAQRSLGKLRSYITLLPIHKNYTRLPKGPFRYERIDGIYDPKIAELSDKAVDMVNSTIASALNAGARRVAGSLRWGVNKIGLATSRDVQTDTKETFIYVDVRAFVNSEATGHGDRCSRLLSDFEPEEAGRESGEVARMSTKKGKIDPGVYDTIFHHAAVANILNNIAMAASAFYVSAGFSFFKGKLGQEIASDKVTLIDNPLYPGGFGSRPFDDEGVPTRKTVIIKEGHLKTFLHNRLTAKEFNTETTANAGWISPSAWQIELKTGDSSIDELLSLISKGLVVMNATYTRFQNYQTGEFSSIIRDGVFYVENGDIKFSVRNLRLSDSFLNILKNVAEIGKEKRQIYHWWLEQGIPVIAPPILVRNVKFTAPGK